MLCLRSSSWCYSLWVPFPLWALVLKPPPSFTIACSEVWQMLKLGSSMRMRHPLPLPLLPQFFPSFYSLPLFVLVLILYHSNPLGRIMNRFSRDQDMLDTGITERMYQFFAALVYPSLLLSSLSCFPILQQ